MSDNGSIVGKIINQQDGQPLAGVTLELQGEGGSYQKSSDQAGEFAFADLAFGTAYELQGQKSGFHDETWGPLAVTAGPPTELMLAMSPRAV